MIVEILRKAAPSNHPIDSGQFNEWKNHPVTERLYDELYLAVLESFENDLPASADAGVTVAYERQGALKMLDELQDWKPRGMVEERNSKERSSKERR